MSAAEAKPDIEISEPAGRRRSEARILHLNSMLKGGGTDDRSVKIAHALLGMNYWTAMAGPAGREFSQVVASLNIPFFPVPLGPLKLAFIARTARLIRRERIGIVHARHGRDYWPAILAAKLSGAHPRIVLSRHLARSPGSWLSRQYLLGRCDALLACSEFTKKVLCEGVYEPNASDPQRWKRGPMRGDFSKIKVVYGGIDMQRFRPADATNQREAWGLKPGEYAFGVVGFYDFPRGKGQREFLQAAARIAAQRPEARFLIIGWGNMKEALDRDIKELGLQRRAWLTGLCRDMPAGMNAMDCLVHPAVSTESWGSVICEAHACGRPVIASDLDGIPEAFGAGRYGELVKPDSVEALGEAMLRWAGRPALLEAQRWELHAKVGACYSLENAAAGLSEIYRSLA
jgi:glycosyltransferase involved in cell wall biosynthesis